MKSYEVKAMRKVWKTLVSVTLLISFVGCTSNMPVKEENNNPVIEEIEPIDIGEVMNQIIIDNFAEGSFIDYDDEYLRKELGIDVTWLNAYIGKYPMMVFEITEIGMFDVKKEHVKDVEKALEAYKDNKKTEDAYPSQAAIAKEAQMFTKGNYIFFVMCDNATSVKEQVEAIINK